MTELEFGLARNRRSPNPFRSATLPNKAQGLACRLSRKSWPRTEGIWSSHRHQTEGRPHLSAFRRPSPEAIFRLIVGWPICFPPDRLAADSERLGADSDRYSVIPHQSTGAPINVLR